MNYLGHCYLSGDNHEWIVGNMIGDFIKGNINEKDYPEEIKKGIKLHRYIDSFTDRNKFTLLSKKRINNNFGLYKGIMIDVFYDHFLAKNWSEFSDVSLYFYTLKVYDILNKHINILPDKFIKIFGYMSANNWLYSYKEVETVDIVLKSISRRFRKDNILYSGYNQLIAHYIDLESDFRKFFEEIINHINGLKL